MGRLHAFIHRTNESFAHLFQVSLVYTSMSVIHNTELVEKIGTWNGPMRVQARGSQTLKVLPLPGVLSAVMRPPSCSTRVCAMERPSPVPWRERARSAR